MCVKNKIRVGYLLTSDEIATMGRSAEILLEDYDYGRFDVFLYVLQEEQEKKNIPYKYGVVVNWDNIIERIRSDKLDFFAGLTYKIEVLEQLYKKRVAKVQLAGLMYTAVNTKWADVIVRCKGKKQKKAPKIRWMSSPIFYKGHAQNDYVLPSPAREKDNILLGAGYGIQDISDYLLEIYGEILKKRNDCQLIFGFAEMNEYTQSLIRKLSTINSTNKVVVFYNITRDEYYKKIDAWLVEKETINYIELCDALYKGIPVLYFASGENTYCHAYRILQSIKLSELCIYTRKGCVNAVCGLSEKKIKELRYAVHDNLLSSALMDGSLFMMELERIYGDIYDCCRNDITAKKNPVAVFDQGMYFINVNKNYGYRRAKAYFEEANHLAPYRYEPLLILSDIYNELGDYEKCYNTVCKCLDLLQTSKEDIDIDVWGTLYARMAITALNLGEYNAAFESYMRTWQITPLDKPQRQTFYSAMLLAANYMDFSAEDMYELHCMYQKQFLDREMYKFADERRKGKIRIGYLSPDFRRHVMFSFYYGLLFEYNKELFEVYCYHCVNVVDEYTKRIMRSVDAFFDVSSLSFEEIAQKIYEDKIDVLVDLAGHSSDNKLPVLNYRPAPVQISGIGYMETTGLKTVDYFITDEIIDPPELQGRYFTENPLYMPSHFSYHNDLEVPNILETPAHTKGYVVFGCFNRYSKITDAMLCCWREIMGKVPTSKLLLKAPEYKNEFMHKIVYRRLKENGIDIERVIIEGPSINYMERYMDVDIALDTFPYTGGGTTMDALYMGVPVVSKYGNRRNTRFGLGILKSIGLEELASGSDEEYVCKAVALSNDIELLNLLHKRLPVLFSTAKNIQPKFYVSFFEKELMSIVNDKGLRSV